MMADYMLSFFNYYGITEGSDAYTAIAASFEKSLIKGLGEDLNAIVYLLRCGLTQQEIDALTLRLTSLDD